MKKLFIILSLLVASNFVTTSSHALDYKSIAKDVFTHITGPQCPIDPAYKKIIIGVAAAGASALCAYDSVSMSVEVLNPGYVEFQGRLHSYSAVACATMAILSACFFKSAANDFGY